MGGVAASALDQFVSRGEAVLALGALVGAFWYALRRLLRFTRKASKVADKVFGDEDNPGLFDVLDTMQANQHRILHELFPNGGGSLRDAVDAVRVQIVEVRDYAQEAKERAAEAVDEAAALQAALGRADHAGRAERERAQASLDAVMDAFLKDRQEQHYKTAAYVDALLELGIDLTPVVEQLEEKPWDGIDRRD